MLRSFFAWRWLGSWNPKPRRVAVPSIIINDISSPPYTHHSSPWPPSYPPRCVTFIMNPSPPLTSAQLFGKDDQEFCTITTLLHKIPSHDRVTLDNLYVSRQQRPLLKLLSALSTLLVRNHEILAVMLKRSVRGTTVFVGSEADDEAHPPTNHPRPGRRPGHHPYLTEI